MKQNREFNEFENFKRKAKPNENYFITIICDNGVTVINLAEKNKNLFTFGKGSDNDIVINSDSLDYQQGYLEITEFGVLVTNTSAHIPMFGNNKKSFDDLYLSEGSFVKIMSPDLDDSNAVIIIMSISKTLDEWQTKSLNSGKTTIGSSGTSDIVLPPNGVAKTHASINKLGHNITIRDYSSLNGTYVNGMKLLPNRDISLNNFDVILIGNTKIILYNDKLIYQIYQKGIKLEAIDIVKRVKIKFKVKEISSHVNMTVNPSEFVAFVGGSGAGKTTFMKCISGVDEPSSGVVLLNGENLYENYAELKHNIGYVPQEDIVYSNLTLYDMLKYTTKLRMPDNSTRFEREERIDDVLNTVQLTDFKNSYIRQLSGGQRKRASIAVELIADPSLFFLDEPTSGLDPDTERSLMKTLREMSKMGKTIILVTHNTLNLHLCDKVAFFGKGGHLCFYGSPQEALDFFEVDDFVDIYTLLNEDMEKWNNKFKAINEPKNITTNIIEKKINNKPTNQKKSFVKQLLTLIRRYVKLISNDFQQLLLLFAQAPVVGLLLSLVSTEDLYTSYDDTKAILFSLGCASIWLGLLNSVQEICKEKIILQKEHMSDLKLPAYLLSKFIVQGVIAFIQAYLLVFVFQKMEGASEYSVLIDSFWDIQLICFLSILSAATLGLFISSIVKNGNIAMSLIPLILVPQLLFSGMLFKLEGIANFISNFILCRWSVEGLGTSTNLNDLTHLVQTYNPLAEIEPEDYFTFTSEHMIQVILVILLMTFVLLIASFIALKKNIKKNL